jgi:MFS family permease
MLITRDGANRQLEFQIRDGGIKMAVLAIPIIILNFLAGIVGGIWLAYLGYWHVILVGLGLAFLGTFVISLLLIPSMLFIIPFVSSERLAESRIVMVPLSILSVGYTYSIMGVWAIAIFWYFSVIVGAEATVPVILWSYSTATAVWNYLAQKEVQSGNEFSGLSATFNQFGCIALMVYVYVKFPILDPYEMAYWFGTPMLVSLGLQITLMMAMARTPRY